MRSTAAILLALVPLGAAAQAPAPRDRVVVRFDNRSSSPSPAAALIPEMQPLLLRKGYDLVTDEQAQPGAAVLAVTIEVYLPPKARTRGPKAGGAAGLSARLIGEDGQVTWRNSIAIIGDEAPASYTKLRRADPAKALASSAIEKLLWTLPRARNAPPESVAGAPVEIEQRAPAATATRYEAQVRRQRLASGVARFPLKMERQGNR